MKKTIILFMSIFLCGAAPAQQDQHAGKRMAAKDSLYVNGKWISAITDDTAAAGNSKKRVLTEFAKARMENTVANLITGNVGIGTTMPTAKLHVVGNAKITGDLNLTGIPAGAGTKALRYDPITGDVTFTDTSLTSGGGGTDNLQDVTSRDSVTNKSIATPDIKLTGMPQSTFSLARAMFNALGGKDSMVLAAGVIRPNATGGPGSFINWQFLTPSDGHDSLFFTGVSPQSGGQLRITYPTVSQVLYLGVVPDETTAKFGLVVGATVGLSHSDIFCYRPVANGGTLTGSGGTSWNKSGFISGWSVNYTNGTGFTTFTIQNSGDALPLTGDDYDAVQISYQGNNPYLIKRQYSALGADYAGFYLTDAFGNPVTGNLSTSDKVTITARPTTKLISTYQVDGTGYQSSFWNSSANIWVFGVFKKGGNELQNLLLVLLLIGTSLRKLRNKSGIA